MHVVCHAMSSPSLLNVLLCSLFCVFFSNRTDIFEISCLRRLANLADA